MKESTPLLCIILLTILGTVTVVIDEPKKRIREKIMKLPSKPLRKQRMRLK